LAKSGKLNGVWRTVSGRRVFISDGESLESAMNKSGKFSNKDIINDYSKDDIVDDGKILDDIIKKQGFDGKPKVVSPEEFDKIDSTVIYRGIDTDSPKKIMDEFVNGEFRISGTNNARFGRGIYTSTDKDTAEDYSGDFGVIQRMKIASDAKIATHSLSKLREQGYDYSDFDKTINNYYAAKGFDAVKHKGGPNEYYYVILNRSKIITDNINYKNKKII
jgi:hypothetical protein